MKMNGENDDLGVVVSPLTMGFHLRDKIAEINTRDFIYVFIAPNDGLLRETEEEVEGGRGSKESRAEGRGNDEYRLYLAG